VKGQRTAARGEPRPLPPFAVYVSPGAWYDALTLQDGCNPGGGHGDDLGVRTRDGEPGGEPPEYDPFPIGGPYGQPPVLLVFHAPAGRDLTVAKASIERGCTLLRQQGWEAYQGYHLTPERAALVFRRPVSTS
jgi:hypothetical protein